MTHRFALLFDWRWKDLIVAIALLWAALIVAVTGTLHGTQYADQLLPVLAIAVLGSVAIVVAGVKAIHG